MAPQDLSCPPWALWPPTGWTGPGWAPGSTLWKILGMVGTFGILGQHGVEAAKRGELQGEAERVDTDADEGHDAGVLQGVQHAGLLPELREVPHGVCGPKVPQHGVCRERTAVTTAWGACVGRLCVGALSHSELPHRDSRGWAGPGFTF